MKCRTFWKKDGYSSLIFSEIIESEIGDYLKFWKVMLQNTIR